MLIQIKSGVFMVFFITIISNKLLLIHIIKIFTSIEIIIKKKSGCQVFSDLQKGKDTVFFKVH